MNLRECATCGDPIDGIVEVVTHECDEILRAQDLTSGEQDTLLYVEHRMVDHRGSLDHEQMNWEDQQNLKVFHAAGILEVEEFTVTEFSDRAWDLARDCRQMRAHRTLERDINLGEVPGEADK